LQLGCAVDVLIKKTCLILADGYFQVPGERCSSKKEASQ
jgi:hypothetical protein